MKTREATARTECRSVVIDRHNYFESVSPCPRVSAITAAADQHYCFGVGGGGGGAPALRVALCFRWGFAALAVVNEAVCGSPGTVVSVKPLPIFLARIDIAGWAGGGFGPGGGGVRSPIITVTAV